MIKLLIIADDFTGALDTGVQFSNKGIETKVIVENGENLDRLSDYINTSVLVVDIESRHSNLTEAYDKVYKLVQRAIELGFTHIFKKTDSALRGNIGIELAALLDAANQNTLPFIPAFPDMNRTTVKGVHYIDGNPVSESVFGKDPFEPVTKDSVKDIINIQSDILVDEAHRYEDSVIEIENENVKKIVIFDSVSNSDIDNIVKNINLDNNKANTDEINNIESEENSVVIFAGCAGLATSLAKTLDFKKHVVAEEKLNEKLVVICGSVNPITKAQLNHGVKVGYKRKYMSLEEKFNLDYWNTKKGEDRINEFKGEIDLSDCYIIDSNDNGESNSALEYATSNNIGIEDVRSTISKSMGVVLKKLIEKDVEPVYLVTGGDTLFGFMEKIGVWELDPICEISKGCVLTKLNYRDKSFQIITKSGGFGEETLLEDLVDSLKK